MCSQVVDADRWLPMFRDPSWIGDDRLLFATDDPALGDEDERGAAAAEDERGAARWSVTLDAAGPTGE
jgi:hypothetical protein